MTTLNNKSHDYPVCWDETITLSRHEYEKILRDLTSERNQKMFMRDEIDGLRNKNWQMENEIRQAMQVIEQNPYAPRTDKLPSIFKVMLDVIDTGKKRIRDLKFSVQLLENKQEYTSESYERELGRRKESFDHQLQTLQEKYDKLKAKKQKLTKQPRTKYGYVYVVQEQSQGHYKIGRAKNPGKRTQMFAVKMPFKIKLDILIQTDDMYALESDLHKHFAHKRVNGEWFALDSADLDYIRKLSAHADF